MTTTTKKYRPHFKRGDKPRKIFLTDRDYEILLELYKNRFLSFSLLAQLFPPQEAYRRRRYNLDPDVSLPPSTNTNLRKRLADLYHTPNEYVHRFRVKLKEEQVYTITKKGYQALVQAGLAPALTRSKTDYLDERDGSLSTLFVEHDLLLARFRTALTLGLDYHPTLELDIFQRESKDFTFRWARTMRKTQRVRGKEVKRDVDVNRVLRPDAFLRLRNYETQKPEPLGFFVEADRSTMQYDRLLDKILKYEELLEEGYYKILGIEDFFVLFVTPSVPRAEGVNNLLYGEDSPIQPKTRKHIFSIPETAYLENTRRVLSNVGVFAHSLEKV